MKVMVVEDEAMIAMVIEDMLADLGCDVVGPFAAVQPALDFLATERPDAAFLDVNLGGEKVYPVADALKAAHIPFLFATGYGAIEEPRFEGATVLTKPLDPDRLAEAVGRLRAA